jgi:hypothetical protein
MAIETFNGKTLNELLEFLRRYKYAQFYFNHIESTAHITDKFIGGCVLPQNIECVDNSINLTLTKGTTVESYTFPGVLFEHYIFEVHCL